jgi:hypothetical protein
MRFCLLLMWGVTLSSSTLLRRELTPIESIADDIQQSARQLDEAAGGIEGTDGSNAPPEVTGTELPAAAVTPGYTASAPVGTPETDPCADVGVDSCDACKDAGHTLTEDDKTCWWDGSSCSKTEEASHVVDEMCEPPEAAQEVTTAVAHGWWKNGTCSKVSDDQESGEMCVVEVAPPTAQPTVSPTFNPTERPVSSKTNAASNAHVVITHVVEPQVVLPQQNYPDEDEGFGIMKVLAFVFFGAITVLGVRSARMRSSKLSGRYQEM